MVSGWGVVLKTETVIHRGIEQIGHGYSGRIAEMTVSLSNFSDPSERGSAHNRIIQEYLAYIKSCAINNSRQGSIMLVEAGERVRALERMGNQDLVKEVGYLLTQLQNLVKLGPLLHQAIRNYRLKVT